MPASSAEQPVCGHRSSFLPLISGSISPAFLLLSSTVFHQSTASSRVPVRYAEHWQFWYIRMEMQQPGVGKQHSRCALSVKIVGGLLAYEVAGWGSVSFCPVCPITLLREAYALAFLSTTCLLDNVCASYRVLWGSLGRRNWLWVGSYKESTWCGCTASSSCLEHVSMSKQHLREGSGLSPAGCACARVL